MTRDDWTLDATGEVVSRAWLATVERKGLVRCGCCGDWTSRAATVDGACPDCLAVQPSHTLACLVGLAMLCTA